jgi:hypothetical protein
MAQLQYLDNVHNPQPIVTVMNVGDYLVSPSGVYNGVLNSNGVFTVSDGSAPHTQPALWSVNPNTGPDGNIFIAPWTVQNVPQFGTSQYYVFGVDKNFPQNGSSWTDGQLAVNQNNATQPDFMQLNDSGQLVIYQGNNGVKTNPNENPVQTRTPGKSVSVTSITVDKINYDTADSLQRRRQSGWP